MEQNKNRHSKPKFTKLEIVFLILAGVFLILAIVDKIISVHADEIIEPPHDPQYNNLVFITMSNEMIIGGDTVIELFEGSADGYYATVWKNNFVQAINDFFQYIPKDQCFIIVASDGASFAHMTAIREVLTEVGASYWSGSEDGYWDPSTDYSGYEDKRAPAGDYFIRYMSRIIKYAPTSPSPSPTPDPSIQEYNILIPCSDSAFFKNNYMFSFKASGINETYIQPQDDTWNVLKTQFPDITRELQYNAAIFRVGRYSGSWLGGFYGQSAIFYIQVQSYSDIKFYSYSGSVVSDIDVMKTVGTVSDGTISNNNNFQYSSYYIQELDSGGYCIAFVFRDGEYWSPNFNNVISDVWFQNFTIESTNQVNNSIPFQQNSTQYSESLKLRLDVENNAIPDPNITPTPSPSPAPTDIPYIQIVTPPLPSPVGTIGFDDPGFSKLNSGAVNNQFEEFESSLENNAAFGLLAMAFSFVPMELRSIVWLILLIAIILATIRVFLHFFG